MLRGEVNPCGVAVAKASPNRALPSLLSLLPFTGGGMVGVVELRGVDPKRSDLPMARVKRL
jgi:hypothetical protein